MENLVQRNDKIKKRVWQALKDLRFEEKNMDKEELEAKDKALANEMLDVPTNWTEALVKVPAKDKDGVVRFVLRKLYRPDSPAGNLPLCNYKLGNRKGTYFFPANGIYSKKHPKGRGLIFCRLADVTRFERMGFEILGVVGPYDMDHLVKLGARPKATPEEEELPFRTLFEKKALATQLMTETTIQSGQSVAGGVVP